MDIGQRITELRKKKNWLQTDLAKKIVDAFGVSLYYLVGEGQNASFDKKTVQRLHDIEGMKEDFKEKFFFVIDTMIRDYKSGQACTIKTK